MGIQLISDKRGNVTAVQIPIKQWKKIAKKLAAFNVVKSINAGYVEMLQIENGLLERKNDAAIFKRVVNIRLTGLTCGNPSIGFYI